MSSRTPIIRQVSWPASAIQLAALAFLIVIASLVLPRDGAIWGAAAYLAYSLGMRGIVPWYHRAGIRLIKQQRFAEAIPCFKRSLAFFERYSWIDRFRALVLMSPSAISYQEMALANIAFCHGQLGDGARARRFYEECLARFPESGIARSALRMMDAAAGP